MAAQILFILLLGTAGYFIWKRFRFVRRNIMLGRAVEMEGSTSARWATMARVALGQGKMFSRPLAAVMHVFIYAGFIIINIEVLEILVDGVSGSHRSFAFLGGFYDFLIASFEWLAVLVLIACVVFLARRNVVRLPRFTMRELTRWPRTDANLILITEILLMTAFLTMNGCDHLLQLRGEGHYVVAGSFPVSGWLSTAYSTLPSTSLMAIERICWWFHIAGILGFIVYLGYSKHLHILLAFPTTYYSKLKPAGEVDTMENVTREVRLMLEPSAAPVDEQPARRFGARDVTDLSWVQLLQAMSCTECGRCTSECPASQTGKLLSPRKVMMDTRDRLEEVGKHLDTHQGKWEDDGKALLRDYISEEELWACTTCNACTQACPVNINPLSIILDLRRFLIMEESRSPESITAMFNNIENNGAPWAMPATDRANWINT